MDRGEEEQEEEEPIVPSEVPYLLTTKNVFVESPWSLETIVSYEDIRFKVSAYCFRFD